MTRCLLIFSIMLLLDSRLLAETEQLFGTWQGTWFVDEKFSALGPLGSPPYDPGDVRFVIRDFDPVAQNYGVMELPGAYSGVIASIETLLPDFTMRIVYPQINDPTAHTLLAGQLFGDNVIYGNLDDSLPPPDGLIAWRGPVLLVREDSVNPPLPIQFQAPFYKGSPHRLTTGPGHHPAPIDEFAVDLAAGSVDVITARRGIAYVNNRPQDYGKYVTIDHGLDPTDPAGQKRIFTVYAHLKEAYVESGQPVSTGDLIGIQGNTGVTSGPTGVHLHFGVNSGDPTILNEVGTWKSVEFTPDFGTVRFATAPVGPFEQFTTYCTISTPCLFDVPLNGRLYSDVTKPTVIRHAGNILTGESLRHNLSVDPLAAFMNFELTWPGSEMSLEVIQPDGKLYERLQDTRGHISDIIVNPLPGLWSFRITAVDLPSSGDPYTFVAAVSLVPEPQSRTLFLTTLFSWLAVPLRLCRGTANLLR